VSVEDGWLVCDACELGEQASLPGGSLAAIDWVTVWVGMGEAHLCPRCVERRALGLLGAGVVLRCSGCERTSEELAYKYWYPLAQAGVLCADCHLSSVTPLPMGDE